jgi:hypothetical protein
LFAVATPTSNLPLHSPPPLSHLRFVLLWLENALPFAPRQMSMGACMAAVVGYQRYIGAPLNCSV